MKRYIYCPQVYEKPSGKKIYEGKQYRGTEVSDAACSDALSYALEELDELKKHYPEGVLVLHREEIKGD